MVLIKAIIMVVILTVILIFSWEKKSHFLIISTIPIFVNLF